MWFVTQQSFLEAPDGTRSLFTTSQNYEPGMIWVFQGSAVVEAVNRVEITPNQIRFIDGETTTQIELDPVNDNTLLLVDHGLSDDDPIILWSSGAEPDGLARGLEYYVLVVDADRFQVSLTPSGTAVVFTRTGSGVLNYSEALAPISASGALSYNAFLAGAAPSTVLTDGLWNQEDFIDLFNLQPGMFGFSETQTEEFEQRVAYALHAASVLVRGYLSRHGHLDFYTDAKSPTPVNIERVEMLRYVESLLAFKILQEEPGIIGKGPTAERIEKFTDAIQITERYQAYGAQKFTTIIKSNSWDILDMFLMGYMENEYGLSAPPMALSHALPDRPATYNEERLGFYFRTA